MAARIDLVTFSEKPPTVQEIADQVSKLTGLDVRVDLAEGSYKQSIAFEAIPEEKIRFAYETLRDAPDGPEMLLNYATAGDTLLFATRVALESLGCDHFSSIPKISDKIRRKYGGKTALDELLRRHRLEELRTKFIERPIAYAIGGCFIAALLLGSAFVRHDSETLRRKLRGKARSSDANL